MAAPAPRGEQSETLSLIEVDVELVLAVDVSFSMDAEEQEIQRQGYIDALRSEEFVSAVKDGALGKVAISYVEWGGAGSQVTTVPWRLIEDEKGAQAFADELKAKPVQRIVQTSISDAIKFSGQMIKSNAYKGLREVIDVSGDGPNNSGQPVERARDWAEAAGITINGLPLLMKRDDDGRDIPDLDAYYRQCVITGPGAFVIPVRSKEQFKDAIRSKIIREIASVQPVEPAIVFASDKPKEKINCLIGEKLLNTVLP